jgi:tetratricopeptide (TPR) repeat protein
MRGLEGAARAAARAAAVEAYRAVRVRFPDERTAAAEAAFRAGELLRAGGGVEEALREFESARGLGAGTPFRARAELEIGHLHRRGGRVREALDAYLVVRADASAARSYRDEAGLWAGKAWRELGHARDARRAWMGIARGAEDPLDRVRAYDLLALDLVDSGDLEGAAGVLHRCRLALEDVALEETRLGERVRRALESMRALDRLARAIQRRRLRAPAQKHGVDNARSGMVQFPPASRRGTRPWSSVGPEPRTARGPQGPSRHRRTARARLARAGRSMFRTESGQNPTDSREPRLPPRRSRIRRILS